MEQERRKNDRSTVSLEAKLFGSNDGYRARVSDVSMGGCYVETIASVSVGDNVAVQVKAPNGNWISLKGKVTAYHPTVGFGMSFSQLSQEVTDFLKDAVERINQD
jgi:hypothetical protein